MSPGISLRQGTASDLAIVRTWLADAGLPIEDLTPEHMPSFVVATRDDVAVGMIGLESWGDVGLLRSLIVDRSCRGSSIGRQLVDALERRAVNEGITELWLLTIDAEAYFSARGYKTAERNDAPEAIRGTQEFTSLCPGDAVLMRKML